MRAAWLVAFAALVGGGWLALERARERVERPLPAHALAELRAELAEGRAALARLQRDVARREREVAALRASLGGAEALGQPGAGEGATSAAGPADGAAGAAAPSDAPVFDAERLAEAGLGERDRSELRELVESTELERLALRDRAVRERWPAERLASELGGLDERLLAVRRDRGEATWDWLLYASGRPNRLVVQGVLGRSAAEEAGLQPGDVVFAYDDVRLFEPDELVESTHAGRLGERIELEVERGGARMRVTVPRGPLGVKVAGVTVRPATPAER